MAPASKRHQHREEYDDTQETITVSRAGTMKINVAVASFIFALIFQGGSFIWWASGQSARLTAVEKIQSDMQTDMKSEQASRNDMNTHLSGIEQNVKDLRDMWFNRSPANPQPAQVYIPAGSSPPQVIMQQAPQNQPNRQ